MTSPGPLVRVVVVNFDGGQVTIDCLRSVLATDWPADRLDVVLVDNGSLDDVVERVRAELPQVTVIEPLANTGFAGGCNLGIRAPGRWDFVALINNDAVVDPGWLRPLVAELADGPRVGATCPKLLFDGQYVEVRVDVPDAAPIGRDRRQLGARFTGVRIDGRRSDRLITVDEGFFPPERPRLSDGEEVAWTSWKHGRIRVRVDDGVVPAKLRLRIAADPPRPVSLASDTDQVHLVARPKPTWHEIELGGEPFNVINNAGSALYPGGFGGDRGFLERDDGQYDEPSEVFAWCGGAVVLRRDYLDDVGLFDERLFLYYEDTDLSWRGRLRGWTYRYVPSSVVRHRHAQSAGVGSAVFQYQVQRNLPLVLAKNAPLGMAARAGLRLVAAAADVSVRGVALRPFTVRPPLLRPAAHHWRVLAGYARLLPAMVAARRGAGRSVARRSILSWTQTKDVAR